MAICLALPVVFSACGGNDSESDSNADQSGEQVPTKDGIPQLQGEELTIWTSSTQSEAQKAMFKDFEKQTGAKLNVRGFPEPYFQNALAKWATGERPDILYWYGTRGYLMMVNGPETLLDLSDMAFVDKTRDDYLEMSTSEGGKVYGAMLHYPAVDIAFYNKKVFEKLGIETPSNFEELLQTCEDIKAADPDIAPITMGGGEQWPLQFPAFMMWNNDLKDDPSLIEGINTGKTKFTDPVFVRGIEMLKELHDADCFNKDIATATFADQITRVMDGKGAMTFLLSDLLSVLTAEHGVGKVDETIGVFNVSARDDQAVSWQDGGQSSLYVPKTGNEEKEAAARAFVEWATGPYYQTYIDNALVFPVIEGTKVSKDIPQARLDANELMEANPVPQYQQGLKANVGPFEQYLADMIAGRAKPEEVAERMQSEFERDARRLGLPDF